MEADAAVGRDNGRRRVLLGAVLAVLLGKLAAFLYGKLTTSAWWENPVHRDMFATLVLVGVAFGIGLGLWALVRHLVVPGAYRVLARFSQRDEPVATETADPVPIPEEYEQKLLAYLIEGFQHDLFQLYVAAGVHSAGGQGLPAAMEKLEPAEVRNKVADAAWEKGRARLDERLEKIPSRWELRPEFWDALERGIRESGQVLVTSHASIKSWQ